MVQRFNEVWENVKSHPKLSGVSFEGDVTAAAGHIASVEALVVRLGKAPTPFSAADFYKEVQAATAAAKASCGLLSQQLVGMQKLALERVQSTEAAKELWISDRELLTGKFKAHGVYKCASKLFADGWQSHLHDPSLVGLAYALNVKHSAKQ